MPPEGVSILKMTCGTPNYVASEVESADFSCPSWFPVGAKTLIHRILDPNPETDEQETEQSGNDNAGPLMLNAFDLIILSQGLNLSTLFDRGKDSVKHQTHFISQKPARVVLFIMEVVTQSMGLKTHIRNYKMRLEGLSADKAGHFSVILEVFEVAPSFFMVDIQKASGDVNEYLKICSSTRTSAKTSKT